MVSAMATHSPHRCSWHSQMPASLGRCLRRRIRRLRCWKTLVSFTALSFLTVPVSCRSFSLQRVIPMVSSPLGKAHRVTANMIQRDLGCRAVDSVNAATRNASSVTEASNSTAAPSGVSRTNATPSSAPKTTAGPSTSNASSTVAAPSAARETTAAPARVSNTHSSNIRTAVVADHMSAHEDEDEDVFDIVPYFRSGLSAARNFYAVLLSAVAGLLSATRRRLGEARRSANVVKDTYVPYFKRRIIAANDMCNRLRAAFIGLPPAISALLVAAFLLWVMPGRLARLQLFFLAGFALGRYRPIAVAADIVPADVRRRLVLGGVVVAVSDGGCTLHVRHRPWWMRLMDPPPPVGEQQASTIAVRVAAGDMPEALLCGKQGEESQQLAKTYVEDLVLRRQVYVCVLAREDTGQCIVGSVSYGQWPFRRSLAETLLARQIVGVVAH